MMGDFLLFQKYQCPVLTYMPTFYLSHPLLHFSFLNMPILMVEMLVCIESNIDNFPFLLAFILVCSLRYTETFTTKPHVLRLITLKKISLHFSSFLFVVCLEKFLCCCIRDFVLCESVAHSCVTRPRNFRQQDCQFRFYVDFECTPWLTVL